MRIGHRVKEQVRCQEGVPFCPRNSPERHKNTQNSPIQPLKAPPTLNKSDTCITENTMTAIPAAKIGANITSAIQNLDRFVDQMTANGKSLAGYGAGGRGVMTLAAMRSAPKLKYLVDKKPKRPGIVAPKSGVPLVSLDELASNPVDAILVFSFGYIDEIRREVSALGYQPDQFYSLLDVLAGRF